MKTVIAFFDYKSETKESLLDLYEYVSIGEGQDYETTKDFLEALKTMGRKTGFTLKLKNVVVA